LTEVGWHVSSVEEPSSTRRVSKYRISLLLHPVVLMWICDVATDPPQWFVVIDYQEAEFCRIRSALRSPLYRKLKEFGSDDVQEPIPMDVQGSSRPILRNAIARQGRRHTTQSREVV
jgi:hypothetical protein